MWRALFIGLGVTALILGAECMVIERATVTLPAKKSDSQSGVVGEVQANLHSKSVVPPEWAPWTLLSAGAVTLLYSLTSHKE